MQPDNAIRCQTMKNIVVLPVKCLTCKVTNNASLLRLRLLIQAKIEQDQNAENSAHSTLCPWSRITCNVTIILLHTLMMIVSQQLTASMASNQCKSIFKCFWFSTKFCRPNVTTGQIRDDIFKILQNIKSINESQTLAKSGQSQ